jgi:SAM-dependent methyltransferase
MGSAGVQGELWGARPHDWAEIQEPQQAPFYEAVFDAIGVSGGTRLLDAGCGAGYAATLAAKRGATVSGIDAADALVEVARQRLPAAEFRVGDIEELPYADGSFSAVTAFNSVQYAADPVAALGELRRAAETGAPIAVVTWGAPERCEMRTVLAAVGSLLPPAPPGAGGPFALSTPGALEGLVESAGLRAMRAEEVPTPFHYVDAEQAWLSIAASGPGARAIREAGAGRARHVVGEAFATHQRTDGTVHLDNVFRFVVAQA